MKNVTKAEWAGQYPVAQIVKRAAVVALVIGATLTLLSQPDAVFGNAELEILQMALVFITPFLVVSISQVFGIREGRKALSHGARQDRGFAAVMFSHGIPLRAAALGLAAAAMNTGLVSIALVMAGQTLAQLPVNLIAQALLLPIIFGALSQTLSFRRTVSLSA